MRRQMTTGGWSLSRFAAWLAALGACWFVLQTASPAGGVQVTYSSVAVTVGIDADPTGDTGTSLGSIESCRSVANGATFSVDFWVKDILSPGIEGFQGTLNHDENLLIVRALSPPDYAPTYNVKLLLAANTNSQVQDLTPTGDGEQDHLPDADGTFTPTAYDFGTLSGHSETGSGVLARITFHAIANGTSQITVTCIVLLDPAATPSALTARSRTQRSE